MVGTTIIIDGRTVSRGRAHCISPAQHLLHSMVSPARCAAGAVAGGVILQAYLHANSIVKNDSNQDLFY